MSKLCREHLKWFYVKEFNKECHCSDESVLSMANGTGGGRGNSHMWGRLWVLLQRGNAAILGNRVPVYPGAMVDGNH